MNTRGQDLSLTTIIVAALGLLVLVVVAAIMTGQLGGFGIRLGETQTVGQCDSACKAQYSRPGIEEWYGEVVAKSACTPPGRLMSGVNMGTEKDCCCKTQQ